MDNNNVCACKGHVVLGYTSLHREAAHQKPKNIKKMLAKHPEFINAVDKRGLTPLAVAIAKGGQEKVLKKLLEANPDIGIKTCKGWTVLHIAACYSNDVQVMQQLLDHKDALQLVNTEDLEGNTPLALAVKHDQFDVIQCLLEKGANPAPIIHPTPKTLPDFLKKLALSEYYFELFDYLITTLGQKAGFQKDDTTLNIAAAMGSQALVNAFLRKEKGTLNAEIHWKVLLYLIVANDCETTADKKILVDIIRCLLEASPTLIQVAEKNGLSVLNVAVFNNVEDLVPLLLRYDADPNRRDIAGCTALTQAVLKGSSVSIVDHLMESLSNRKAKLDLYTVQGESILYLAAINDKSSIMKMMKEETKTALTRETALNIKFELNEDPQLGNERIKILQNLLKHGFNANITNTDGKTALHAAVQYFKPKPSDITRPSYMFIRMIELLIRYGANPFVQDHEGQTPLDFACSHSAEKGIKKVTFNTLKVKTQMFKTQIETIREQRESGLSVREAVFSTERYQR